MNAGDRDVDLISFLELESVTVKVLDAKPSHDSGRRMKPQRLVNNHVEVGKVLLTTITVYLKEACGKLKTFSFLFLYQFKTRSYSNFSKKHEVLPLQVFGTNKIVIVFKTTSEIIVNFSFINIKFQIL